MRTKQEYKSIIVTKNVHDRIVKDQKLFQKIIGGGTWSINDTLNEWIKILNGVENGNKRKKPK